MALPALPQRKAKLWQSASVRVLIVEDDDAVARPLQEGLAREGYDVQRVATGEDALSAAPTDVVLLDLGLPDVDGFDVCRQLRARSDVPIIVLTARGEELDRVLGLELGADDYLVKPYGFRELVARIRAVTRRRERRGGVAEGPVRIGALALDRRTHEVQVDGAAVAMTPKEFELLAMLAADPGAVRTRREILETVWDAHWYGPTKTLDVHVASLRRKLGDAVQIETVRGVGFRLRP